MKNKEEKINGTEKKSQNAYTLDRKEIHENDALEENTVNNDLLQHLI